jgi:hypothetical protein
MLNVFYIRSFFLKIPFQKKFAIFSPEFCRFTISQPVSFPDIVSVFVGYILTTAFHFYDEEIDR